MAAGPLAMISLIEMLLMLAAIALPVLFIAGLLRFPKLIFGFLALGAVGVAFAGVLSILMIRKDFQGAAAIEPLRSQRTAQTLSERAAENARIRVEVAGRVAEAKLRAQQIAEETAQRRLSEIQAHQEANRLLVEQVVEQSRDAAERAVRSQQKISESHLRAVASVPVPPVVTAPQPPNAPVPNGGSTEAFHSSHVRVSFGALWLPLFLIPFIGFLVARRRVRSKPTSGLGWVLGGAACLALAGFLLVGGYSRQEVIPGQETAVNTYPRQQSEATADEVWEQLTAPRIELTERKPSPMPDAPGDVEGQPRNDGSPGAVDAPSQARSEGERIAESEAAKAEPAVEAAAERDSEASLETWYLSAAKVLIDEWAERRLKASPKSTPEDAKSEPAADDRPAQQLVAAQEVPPAGISQGGPNQRPSEFTLKFAGPLLQRTSIEKSPPPPHWIQNAHLIDGDDGKVVITAGPYSTLEECHLELERQAEEVVRDRVRRLSEERIGRPVYIRSLGCLDLPTDEVIRRYCEGEYVENVATSVGEMKTAHVLMTFDDRDDQMLVDRAQSYARRDVIVMTSVIAGLAVGVLAFAYGLLKLDTWTRGYYSKQLFIGVPAAVLTLAALGLLVVS